MSVKWECEDGPRALDRGGSVDMLYDVMKKTLKEVLMTLRVRPDVRDSFRVVAEMKGATMSGLIHQFMMRSIRDMQDTYPEEFKAKLRELEETDLPIAKALPAKKRLTKAKKQRN